MKTKYTQAILDIHLIENSDYSHHGLETTQNSNTSEGKNSDWSYKSKIVIFLRKYLDLNYFKWKV